MLTNSRKQQNYFPFKAHQYNSTAFVPAMAGGEALLGCKLCGCEAGGGQSLPAPDANTNPGAITQERSRELGVSRSTVVDGKGLSYLPSLASPTLTALPHNCFQCVTAVKEITVVSAFDRDCRTPCLHTVTLDPSELS